MVQLLFAVETSQSRSLPLDAQRIVNFAFEKPGEAAKSQTPIFRAPGIAPFADANGARGRGAWVMGDVLYTVVDDKLYSVANNGALTQLGSGIAGTALVSMADNGFQLAIVNGFSGWIYNNRDNSFQQIVSAAFYPAETVSFFDGYFVFDRRKTNEFFLSGLYDGLTYNGLDFASAEAKPDFVRGTIQNLQLQFIFCEQHIELWYDAGTNDFPFQRYAGGVVNYGCTSPRTIVLQDGAIFFLGCDRVFYRLQSNYPFRVSTHSIETIIQQEPNIDAAFCLTFSLEGHKFIALTLPTIKRTLIFDVATNRWAERESWDTDDETFGLWRASWSVRCYGQVYVGDYVSGKIGRMDWTVFTEYGNTLRALAYSVPVHKDRKRIFMNTLELDVETGVGLSAGQGSDPPIMLSYSRDGARTFSRVQPWRTMGKIGKYLTRLRWQRMGNARQWVFRIEITDPVPCTIIAANIETEIGL